MKTNTVILSIDDYNRLRDFRENIKNEKVILVTCSDYNDEYDDDYVFITKDKALKMAEEANISLLEEINELKEEVNKLKNTETPKEYIIDELKSMSIWQFSKWKKQNK